MPKATDYDAHEGLLSRFELEMSNTIPPRFCCDSQCGQRNPSQGQTCPQDKTAEEDARSTLWDAFFAGLVTVAAVLCVLCLIAPVTVVHDIEDLIVWLIN